MNSPAADAPPVAELFESWLPQRFAELKTTSPSLGETECSLRVTVDEKHWFLKLGSGQLAIQIDADGEPTFQLRTSEAALRLLMTGAAKVEVDSAANPALKVLSLDAEVVRLASSIPACLKVVVQAPDGPCEAVFGPGHLAPDAVGCSLECQLEDLQQLQSGQADPMELFMSGKLKLDGDPQIAMALGGLLM